MQHQYFVQSGTYHWQQGEGGGDDGHGKTYQDEADFETKSEINKGLKQDTD